MNTHRVTKKLFIDGKTVFRTASGLLFVSCPDTKCPRVNLRKLSHNRYLCKHCNTIWLLQD